MDWCAYRDVWKPRGRNWGRSEEPSEVKAGQGNAMQRQGTSKRRSRSTRRGEWRTAVRRPVFDPTRLPSDPLAIMSCTTAPLLHLDLNCSTTTRSRPSSPGPSPSSSSIACVSIPLALHLEGGVAS